MKKILILMLCVSFKMFGQTPKMDVVVGDTENVNGIRAVLKPTNPTNIYTAITGENNSTNGNGYGVRGFHSGSGSGVFGGSISGVGVYGESAFGGGVSGFSAESSGVYGSSDTGIGGQFTSSNSGYALKTEGKIEFRGLNGAGTNKFLKSTNSNGNAEWSDLLPYAQTSTATTALFKITNTSTSGYNGIQGETFSSGLGFGIHGIANSTTPSAPNAGVWGGNSSTNSLGYGVGGTHSGTGAAVRGETTNGIGGSFESTNGYSIQTLGKIKFAGNGVGIIQSNRFLKSINSNGDAEWSNLLPYSQTSTATTALLKITNTSTSGYNGIQGETFSSGLGFGIHGIANSTTPSAPNAGVWGENNSTNSLGYGVGGVHHGTGAAVKGETTNGIGGHFTSTNNIALITDKGKIGFGNTSPSLNNDERVEIDGRLRIRDSTSTAGVWFNNSANSINSADGAFHGMKTNAETGIFIGGNWRFWVNSAGNGYLNGNLIQTSDKRLKKNFSALKNSLSNIYQLKGYQFNWIEESRSHDLQTGLIAQEVQKIFPELVQTDEKGFLSVNYIGLVPHLIEAVKELRDENNSLKNKNQTLASRLDKIEAMLTANQPNTENLNSKK